MTGLLLSMLAVSVCLLILVCCRRSKPPGDFQTKEAIINEPGTYSVRAHYQGSISNWVEINVKP